MPIATVNPANGELIRSFDALGEDETERRIAAAAETFRQYRTTPFEQRAAWLNRAADLLDEDRDAIARTMTLEMGKPVTAARAEAAKCAKAMRWYADRAEGLLADEHPDPDDARDSGASRALVRYRPLGVVLAVMPWNFPLWQVVRFAAPALMAGNVGLLKHASNVPQTALYLEDLFHRAGFPAGCFRTLLIGSGAVEAVLRDPRVAAATLTGSEPAGRAVAATAGDEIKKTVLELGGSDPYLVLPSADVAKAAATAVTARVQNNGQSCIAAKRFIVHADVYDAFAERFTAGMRALTVGDPLEEGTDIGPLSSEQGRTDLEELVDDALGRGAEALCGGRRPDKLGGGLENGWFYEPTVLASVTTAMRVHREETFGPVATLYRVADLDEAIHLANDTPFGLSSNVWTRDPGEQERCARDLEAGGVFFNGMTASHPALPFGGIKRSGYGRELAGHGIREFCNATTLWYGPEAS
ncbi:NADP-dependent succinic semialdehyde dehydrogenase [Streptomyces griseus]|uniref:Aldehyde dehydrogenase n=1 Tax=Streptomyces griseus subsp. griseus (strain JCM 4626 / CBS 651.72 / NBRC 13350 / KCC S-0626 / ISP 5235) TaxID=455632 RepID=B1VMW6_STRGG|nr:MULTISPECIES: NADP-dependent succinic semialdehyde dehydrogenase [Streptomyces]MYR10210.1 NADP-dependent succinic semialdehyde dehydrogenase [Streptomyces sp. SID724]MYR54408.1 NADP-dependent succinic semialdehyde dehydrogenase [Streptomyces sp. SID4928]EGE46404.1 Succinate-semialdehyde dehydrogenase (NAD(P)(+)) [Streptomyces sp. ACT-1]NEB51000.1 NADP-dependent succinic semialdehyde dehydrogenase [Streptomyces griseus]SEE31185.1 succinate-semialdehyde dehydrogenase / glutarate-semialdehyde 